MTTWSNIETGAIARPHRRTLIKIARSLGVDPEELAAPKGPAPRPDPEDAALAVLFRGLARRGRAIAAQSAREGASEELAEEVVEYYEQANALLRLRGRRDIHGRRSEELHEAEEAYWEAERRIQALIAQDVYGIGEEVRRRRLRSQGAAADSDAETSRQVG